jgi:glycosyltransferase involved in cell wall biosynthesis
MVGEAPAGIRERAAACRNLTLLAPRPRAELTALLERAVAVVSTSEKEGMPNVFLEGWARGVPALALSHDPDGIIERHELGFVAGDSLERLAQFASTAWNDRMQQHAIAARCRAYVAREHGAGEVAARWERVLELRPAPGV